MPCSDLQEYFETHLFRRAYTSPCVTATLRRFFDSVFTQQFNIGFFIVHCLSCSTIRLIEHFADPLFSDQRNAFTLS